MLGNEVIEWVFTNIDELFDCETDEELEQVKIHRIHNVGLLCVAGACNLCGISDIRGVKVIEEESDKIVALAHMLWLHSERYIKSKIDMDTGEYALVLLLMAYENDKSSLRHLLKALSPAAKRFVLNLPQQVEVVKDTEQTEQFERPAEEATGQDIANALYILGKFGMMRRDPSEYNSPEDIEQHDRAVNLFRKISGIKGYK